MHSAVLRLSGRTRKPRGFYGILPWLLHCIILARYVSRPFAEQESQYRRDDWGDVLPNLCCNRRLLKKRKDARDHGKDNDETSDIDRCIFRRSKEQAEPS